VLVPQDVCDDCVSADAWGFVGLFGGGLGGLVGG
jgi:hypothetical protein